MEVELRHLRSFVAVAEERNFGEAAKRLHVTQPPLTRHIRRLEEQLGSELFDRTSRPIRLTASGAAFLEEAYLVLDQFGRALERGRHAGQGQLTHLAIGAAPCAFNGIATNLVRSFRASRPNVSLEFSFGGLDEQTDALLEGRVDVALVGFTQMFTAPHALTGEQFIAEPMVAILPLDHPLAGRQQIALRELGSEQFVVVSRAYEPELFDAQAAAFQERGLIRRVVQEVPDPHAMLGLIAAGVGVGVHMWSLNSLQRSGVTYVLLEHDPPIAAGLFLLWRADEERETVHDFLEVARAVVRAFAGGDDAEASSNGNP